MNIYLDDIRAPPFGWTLVRNIEEAKSALATGTVEHASLDHDLGHGCEAECWDDSGDVVKQRCADGCACACHRTGYDLALWMAETGHWPTRSVRTHSANPVGARNIMATIARYAPERLR